MRDNYGFNVGSMLNTSSFFGGQGMSIERIDTVELSDPSEDKKKSEIVAAFSDVCLNCKVNPDCDDKSIFCGLVAIYNTRASENSKGNSVTDKPKYRKALKNYFNLHGNLPFEEQYKFL